MGLFVRILGLIDVAATIMLFTAGMDWPARWVIYVALALAAKGGIFWSDPVSRFDIIIAVYLCFTILVNIKLLSILLGIYLGIKALYSMV